GWSRIDPTSAVAPSRIREGIDFALPDSIIKIPLGLQNNFIARTIWRRLHDTYDAINNRWNQWVLGYNSKRQIKFLNQIGLSHTDWQGMIIWLLISVGLILVIVSIWMFRQNDLHTDKAKALYDKFCSRLARLGIRRYVSEGPREFAQRAVTRRTDLAVTIHQITNLYISVRYAGQVDEFDLLKQHIRNFKPAR
ncbi:MAG: DUF4129 domain-containing protein, partial [Gammaproteobacteria bacterium]|nr:DUF4129 domain-containing protein [Gammaproteobacteria bacterium]